VAYYFFQASCPVDCSQTKANSKTPSGGACCRNMTYIIYLYVGGYVHVTLQQNDISVDKTILCIVLCTSNEWKRGARTPPLYAQLYIIMYYYIIIIIYLYTWCSSSPARVQILYYAHVPSIRIISRGTV